MDQKVILVDSRDTAIGLEDKLVAHQNGGMLHRAISVFIFNSKGQLMMQKRAAAKYHAANMWSSTCCSHPMEKESVMDAAHRRLKEEMGFDCELREVFSFEYRAEMENGLTEHEYDHFFVGTYEGNPNPNPDEVGDWKWVDVSSLLEDAKNNPGNYSAFFLEFGPKALRRMHDSGVYTA